MDEHKLTEAVELLKSRDIKKRTVAVDIAAELGTAGATALLIKAIQDQSWSLREYAIRKMPLAGHKSVKPLVRLLRDGVWYTRAAALQVLERIDEIGSLPPILPLIGDSNRSVAEAAVKAASSIARNAEPASLLSLAEKMTAGQSAILVKTLSKTDPELSEKIKNHLAGSAPGISNPDAGIKDDESGMAEKLQGLRREFKAMLKQDYRSEDEDT